MIWNKYWKLTIIKREKDYISPKWVKCKMFLCKCDCWKEKIIRMSSLKSWLTNSCWCYNKEISIKNNYRKWLKWNLNPNWKWWISTLWHNIRTSKEYQDWRTNCFKRDNYTCQISWIKWGNLVVHHLDAFHLIIKDLDNENYKDNEILFDLNNWITITKELHDKFHNKYWKTNFTKEDFIEFMWELHEILWLK